MARTQIEWTEYSWNPITGCAPVSEGCEHCYAQRMAKRLAGRYGYPADEPFKVNLHLERTTEPLRWKKPRRVFVCSMGDLFHEDVPRWMRFEVMDIILQAKQHTFLILTKRPANMKEFFEWYYSKAGRTIETIKNLWLGVTAENQARADERIPILLQIPAAVRFVSVEPMLGPVDLPEYLPPVTTKDFYVKMLPDGRIDSGYRKKLDWVICGGETGPGARPMHPDWVRSLRDQCQAAGVPLYFKSWGDWIPSYEAGQRSEEKDQYGRTFGDCRVKACHIFSDDQCMVRVGKKKAGRILDGRTWDEMPPINGR